MSDYPDPDEEYELMYADEIELLKENDENDDSNVVRKKPLAAKRSLDFSSQRTKAVTSTQNSITVESEAPQISLTPSLQPVEEVLASVPGQKRTADDLFGDIDDIDFDEVNLPSKKLKTEEEIDNDLINKIIEGRKLKQILLEPTGRGALKKSSYVAKENMSLNIPRWAFVPLTNADGERIYVKLESEESWDIALDESVKQTSLRKEDVWEEARKILESKKNQQSQELEQTQLPTDHTVNSKLWVDKYRPKSYVELLTEEPVNRALLHWLHLWDKIVFKKEVKVVEPSQRNAFSKRSGQFQLTNKWKGKKEDVPELDEDGRPHHKVALLCGPPGGGKTTLAHLLAGLAGYRPVELNASDERSTEAFRNALQSATLMRSVIDAEKRPNCLILDEIDGAPLPTIELLVKWCTASTKDGKANKKAKVHPLRRPVIAICNDLYAPALRPLRPIALTINVGSVSVARLCSRLTRVCGAEGVAASARVLAALARRAGGDVRAALQLVAFLRARAQLTMEDVMNAKLGERDATTSTMQALQRIFTLSDDPGAFESVLKTVQQAGDYDRIIDGIFENYITSRVDARLNIALSTLSHLRTYDVINSWIRARQNYSLYGMLPLCAASCHALLAARAPGKLKFPTTEQEMNRRSQELSSSLWAVSRGAAAGACAARRALLLDVIPLLPYVLAPKLRSANAQLCSENERHSLLVAARAMCDYGLQYSQRRGDDGVYVHVMQPDIHALAFFGNEERARPPPAIRQAIASQQQLEMIRRTEIQTGKVSARDPMEHQQEFARPLATAASRDKALPNHLQRLRPKEIEPKAPQVHKDFFGRIVPIIESSQRSDAVKDLISSSSVFYQYQEGFNNAVRRNVRTRDLL